MRCLTVRQPYAHWMFTPDDEFGIKTVENRPWATSHRGDLAIHAALRPHPDYEGSRYLKDIDQFGMIIGVVTLVDVHKITGRDGCDCDRSWAEFPTERGARFHWVLSDPHRLAYPIKTIGQLGLWNYDEGIAA